MPPSFFSSPLPRPQNIFLWGLFSFGGNKKKSHGVRSVEYGGWRSWVMLFFG
jgi:hypothetical protein